MSITYPRALENRYSRDLVERTRVMNELTEDAIALVLSSIGESIDAAARMDDASDWVSLLLRAVDVAQGVMQAEEAPDVAQLGLFADETDERNLRELRTVIPISPLQGAPQALQQQNWLETNVDLIESIDERYFDEVREVVRTTVGQGTSTRDMAKGIQERFEVSQGRARVIARDQIGKLNAEINRARQTALGVTEFIWQTAQDDRVREEHEARNGNPYKWSDPPDGEIPGQPIQCRCVPLPVLDS